MLEGWLGAAEGTSPALTGLSREQWIQLFDALAAAYEAAGDLPGAIAAYDQVAKSHTGRRRVRAAHLAIVLRLQSGDEEYALELIDENLPAARSDAERARLLLLKAPALEAVGSESDAKAILEDVASRFPATPHAEEAEGRLRARFTL